MRIWWPGWSVKFRPRSSVTAIHVRSNTPAQLGLALQLVNVIRDVGDDARRGRIYLPIDEHAAL
jgi:phytoene/squalene synthetase